jgi:hypothetical protein
LSGLQAKPASFFGGTKNDGLSPFTRENRGILSGSFFAKPTGFAFNPHANRRFVDDEGWRN